MDESEALAAPSPWTTNLAQPLWPIPADIRRRLIEAQAVAQPVKKEGVNRFQHYVYASAEDVIQEAQNCLRSAGLGLSVVSWHYDTGDNLKVTTHYALFSPDSEWQFSNTVPIFCPQGSSGKDVRGLDQSLAAALTYGLAYTLRGLLLLPRVDPGSVDEREDRPATPIAKQGAKKPQAPDAAPAPAPVPASVPPPAPQPAPASAPKGEAQPNAVPHPVASAPGRQEAPTPAPAPVSPAGAARSADPPPQGDLEAVKRLASRLLAKGMKREEIVAILGAPLVRDIPVSNLAAVRDQLALKLQGIERPQGGA